MTDKFKEILEKCFNKSDRWSVKDGIIYYEIRGFSKSGNVKIYENYDKIFCLARYDELDEIENYDDLVNIAYNWYSRYKDREPFSQPPEEWVEDFVRLGRIKKETKIVYVDA
jgi:hypothetical protein